MSKDAKTSEHVAEQDPLYAYDVARTGEGMTRADALVCGLDREALNTSQGLVSWARERGHDERAAWRAYRAGHAWARRRDARGMLRMSLSDELRAALAETERGVITDDVLDALEREHEATEGSEA